MRHQGHISAGGIDAAYRDKYRRYSAGTLDRITSPQARSTTIQLVPR
jgi:hypothetical protein